MKYSISYMTDVLPGACCMTRESTLMHISKESPQYLTHEISYNNRQLFTEVEVNSGGYLPSCESPG